MPKKKPGLLNLLYCVGIVLIMFFLISLPTLASSSTFAMPGVSGTYTPTLSTQDPDVTNDPSINDAQYESINPSIVISYTQYPSQTYTLTPTLTATLTPSITPTPTYTPTTTATPLQTQFAFLPNVFHEFFIPTSTPTPTPLPPKIVLFCDDLVHPLSIPDNNDAGTTDDISITDNRVLVSLRLYLDISHPFIGDLVVTLTNLNTNITITTLHRPGLPPYGCGNADILSILDDSAIQPANDQCTAYPNAISGIFLPKESLSFFSGQAVAGTWRLNVSDRYINDTGTLDHWCLETRLSDVMPAPTPSPTPVELPHDAYIEGMWGQDQQFKLDCESRSAVDWARHFGFNIDEIAFLNRLPRSDDPEEGFVGDPNADWGNIPPSDYGVHAAPVAELLQDYGLTAAAYKSLSWDDLRSEIASGRPAMVWIIGDDARNIINGTPRYYTAASTGNTTVVARHEHTVILIGYNSSTVTVLNGSRIMDVPLPRFLESWSVLDFMGVLARP